MTESCGGAGSREPGRRSGLDLPSLAKEVDVVLLESSHAGVGSWP